MRADLRTNDVLPHDHNVNAAPLRCIAKLQWVQLDFTDQIAIFFELSEDIPNLFANGSVAKLLKTNNHCFGKSLDSWSSGLGQPIKNYQGTLGHMRRMPTTFSSSAKHGRVLAIVAKTQNRTFAFGSFKNCERLCNWLYLSRKEASQGEQLNIGSNRDQC